MSVQDIPRPDLPRTRWLRRWFHARGWKALVLGVPSLWLALLFLAPFAIVLAISLGQAAPASPPFRFLPQAPFTDLQSYRRLLGDGMVVQAFLTSVANAALTTLICLLVGYPVALGIARARPRRRSLLLVLIILPFWTSFLLRVYAWMGLLGGSSWFNKLLTGLFNLFLPADRALFSLHLMNTNFAVVLVMVYSYLPFMILPLFATLEKLDLTLNEAAMDLGSRPFRVFRDVTLPLSLPGILAGATLVFIPACGELVIPSLVGNSYQPMIGRVISDQFSVARDWPMAAAISVVLLAVLLGLMGLLSLLNRRILRAEGEDA
ncbi:ABC transporter permease [Pseudooceanicola sp. CBS1P-1]|uniref:ABC transporter permease subunit n=1 Tax=Pseudooceanicola albus TaxID=2692189 RepID=A0A6L7GAM5_9RHOB|nr:MULTISPECIES: ABC transporter permease [Pseudooceanicola]MBT9386855.1 ABC transporter permease [Pseudooceanicola endophyticus]MXN21009.1 ABC transporter permease subunit [Pseudooceanicola albus]